ncbi:hypothetical protein ACFZAM_32115 [Streptomyces sp. NPDC008079]|uniref:hypothetical protein n=1 Tax=Streptomyces sp. NPDC008079 TaxID=3364806 RepID=UPI0036E260C1
MSFTLVPVTGTYTGTGGPRTGQVRLELVAPMVNNGEVKDCRPYVGQLDVSGTFGQTVPATDDLGTLPAAGSAYRVTEEIVGLPTAVYYIVVPHDAVGINLGTVQRLTGVPKAALMLQSLNQRGLPGGYPSLGSDGRVPKEQLPDSIGFTIGTGPGQVAAGNDGRIVGAAQKAANLSDLQSASQARTNLGLGTSAVRDVGTSSGQVAAGNDTRIVGAVQASAVGLAADITRVGLASSAGATGRWADAGHTHDISMWTEADNGLLAWTYDPTIAGDATAQAAGSVAGRVTLSKVVLRRQITWSRIWFGLSGLDATATLSNCYFGVYDSNGTLKATSADISSLLMSNPVAKPISMTAPFVAPPGEYFIACLLNGTWVTNTLAFKCSHGGISVNANLAPPHLRYSHVLTGQTSLPSSIALSGQNVSQIGSGWASQWYGID